MSFFDNEIAYLSAFCGAKPIPHGVRLHDPLMPDMYSHNLTCVRDEFPPGRWTPSFPQKRHTGARRAATSST